ncbi:MAG: HlyD family type I secretion periplasmic adaptor subunit [Rhodospirillales bacterium]|nr:HlyD family type I secretion periplasmic adaptor subunit [Rhodospirillales bacterium]
MTWTIRGSALVGLFTVLLLTLGIGVWGAWASLAGAVVSQGQVQIEARAQIVQHRDGGVVASILVKDGDRVAAGDALLVLDEVELASQAKIIADQLTELRGRAARLAAERDGIEAVIFPSDLEIVATDDPSISAVIAGQRSLFAARLATLGEATRSYEEQKLQVENEILGQKAQLTALEEQIRLVADELADAEGLLEKGLTQASRVVALKREKSSLTGQKGALEASVARNLGRMAQIDVEIVGLSAKRREEAVTELRDVEPRMVGLQQELKTLETKLARLTLTAPTEGIVHDLRVHSLGAIIRPADPVLYIIPQEQALVITAKIDAYRIDEVFAGRAVVLRFSAFNARTTPEINAEVARVSADVTIDERSGMQFYTVELRVPPEEIARLGDHTLLPGMPVEVFIQTGERSALSYFAKPFTDYFERAFKD